MQNAGLKKSKTKLTEFEKGILKAKAEVESARKNGTLRTFSRAKEAFKDDGFI